MKIRNIVAVVALLAACACRAENMTISFDVYPDQQASYQLKEILSKMIQKSSWMKSTFQIDDNQTVQYLVNYLQKYISGLLSYQGIQGGVTITSINKSGGLGIQTEIYNIGQSFKTTSKNLKDLGLVGGAGYYGLSVIIH